MDKEQLIKIFSILNKMHANRAAHYKLASRQSRDAGLKALFHDFFINSSMCRQQLAGQMLLLGVKPQQPGGFSGKFLQAWQGLAVAMAGNNLPDILRFCEEEGMMVDNIYTKVLQKNAGILTEYQRQQLIVQYKLITTGLETVRNIMKLKNETARL